MDSHDSRRLWALIGLPQLLAVTVLALATAVGAQAPAPVNVVLKAYPVTVSAGDYELVNQVLDLPPGSGVPRHYHGGPVVVTVVSGELATIDAMGDRVLKTGESMYEKPGDIHSVANRGSTTVRLAVSYLIPKGAERTTLVK